MFRVATLNDVLMKGPLEVGYMQGCLRSASFPLIRTRGLWLTYLGSIIIITRKKRTFNNECVSIGFANPILSTEQRKNSYGRSYVGMYVYQHETRFIVSCMDSYSICFLTFLFYLYRCYQSDSTSPRWSCWPHKRLSIAKIPDGQTNGTNVWIPLWAWRVLSVTLQSQKQ